jgi:hypothetical protein
MEYGKTEITGQLPGSAGATSGKPEIRFALSCGFAIDGKSSG